MCVLICVYVHHFLKSVKSLLNAFVSFDEFDERKKVRKVEWIVFDRNERDWSGYNLAEERGARVSRLNRKRAGGVIR